MVGAATDTSTAEKNRRKPLQRCDQLKGDAELECLRKARERVVESRQKRETKTTEATETSEKSRDEAPKGASKRTAPSAQKGDSKK